MPSVCSVAVHSHENRCKQATIALIENLFYLLVHVETAVYRVAIEYVRQGDVLSHDQGRIDIRNPPVQLHTDIVEDSRNRPRY